MATAALAREPKKSRMDLRLEEKRKELYERAAALKGQSVTQWSLSNLDAAAERDIEDARVTRLSDASFELFLKMIDEPMSEEAAELIRREPSWV